MTAVLLATLGDLDAEAVIPALGERHGAPVAALILDVGQSAGTASARARALAAGAVRAHVIDAREEFARAYLMPLLRAGALRSKELALPRALLRSLVAARLLEVGAMEGTTRLAHGWPPGTPEADHIARTIAAHRPDCSVIAAGAVSGSSRGAARPPCVESTIWWRCFETAGAAARPAQRPSGEPSAVLDIAFDAGMPVSLNGIEMPLVELIEVADTIGGDHGIGGSVAPDGRLLDVPAATVLITAHAAITRAAASPQLQRLRKQVAARYASLVQGGEWLSDARAPLDAFVAESQKPATGVVRLHLRRGRCRVVSVDRTASSRDSYPAGAAVTGALRPSGDSLVSH